MTRQEAIEILRRIQDPEPWEPKITQKCFEALEMAILALNRVSDEDLEAEKKEFLRKTQKNNEMVCGRCTFMAESHFQVIDYISDEELAKNRLKLLCCNPKSELYLRGVRPKTSCDHWAKSSKELNI